MSDKDKLVALLTEFGVGFEEDEYTKGLEVRLTVTCREGMPKVFGYGGFMTTFEFSKEDASFICMGAEE